MNSWIEKPKLKIILLGDSGVGKTSLLKRYEGKEFKQLLYNSTISVDVITKELSIEENSVILQIWDTAGQERFKSVPSWFYRDTDCCVLVYDVNTFKTFDSLNNWHDEFIKQANPMTPNKFPFVLMGNKIDINNGNPRVVAKEMADQWCDSKGNITYFETSAKENTNVDEAFLEMAKKALSNENWIDDIYRNGTVTKVGQLTKVENLTKVEKQPRRCSC